MMGCTNQLSKAGQVRAEVSHIGTRCHAACGSLDLRGARRAVDHVSVDRGDPLDPTVAKDNVHTEGRPVASPMSFLGRVAPYPTDLGPHLCRAELLRRETGHGEPLVVLF